MPAFAHIPTGTTANREIDSDDSTDPTVASATALNTLGADLKTGRATP